MWKKIKKWIQTIFPKDTNFDKNKLIYRTTEMHLASIMRFKLEEEGIHVFFINKMDSSYLNFGSIELYVNQNDVIRAKYIINKTYE